MSADERQRLAALHEYRLLDAPADDELEAVVRVAAMVADVPTATLNLIDEYRQCQLTTTGFEGGDSARSDSMCAIRFSSGEFTYVPDASLDPTYAGNPWVTGLLADVRFYASAPLVTPEGHALGTLCVFDARARELTEEQIARLKDLAQVVLALFERRRQARVNAQLLAEAENARQFTDAVLDTIDVAVVAADPDGRVTVFNRTGREWHPGIAADPLVRPEEVAERYKLFRTDGVTPLTPEEVPLLRALRGGTVSGAEIIIRSPDTEPRHVVVGGRALRSTTGAPLGAVIAMTDVTADRAQRRALEKAHTDLAVTIAELQRSNTELEQFAGVVSHDLAAPLAVVNGYLELLAEEYRERLDEQAEKWFTSATRAVARMQGLIRALLTYARAGSEPCRREKANLGEVADHALMDLRDSIRTAGADVVIDGEMPWLAMDPTLVRQLLQNLIGNAIKYRHPDRPSRVVVAAEPRGGDWLVTVTDNGIGIPESERLRVFEMFAQLDTGRAGHGVGMATCQRIVERHGGHIWADAAPDCGTTITFTLPGA
ncbi:ATP-binding protein [Actinoplanes sp. NPDC051346]|uniref:sensor histidine kinase n=1 Tax=Actinoplanes sp. NPDC051346 TaxID=3155048 RepID=UPI003428037C